MQQIKFMRILVRHGFCLCFGLSLISSLVSAQSPKDDLATYNEPPSRLRGVIEKYNQDYGSLSRLYTAETSTNRAARLKRLYSEHLALINGLRFDGLNHDEQVDYILFRNYLQHELKELARS